MSVSCATQAPFSGLQTGTLSGNGPLGSASYARSVSVQGKVSTIDLTETSASGRVVQDQVTITHNSNGTITRDVTGTGANGKSHSSVLTYGVLQNGTRSVTGTITGPNGSQDQVSGSLARTTSGYDQSLTLTNTAGKTASRQTEVTQSGSIASIGISNTNFAGAALSQQESQTLLSSTAA